LLLFVGRIFLFANHPESIAARFTAASRTQDARRRPNPPGGGAGALMANNRILTTEYRERSGFSLCSGMKKKDQFQSSNARAQGNNFKIDFTTCTIFKQNF